MKRDNLITQEELKSKVDYDPDTGIFLWKNNQQKKASWNTRFGRKAAGGIGWDGYIRISFGVHAIAAHRLAFLYMNGVMPSHEVDHINGKRNDNRWCNLRAATRSQNLANWSILHYKNKTGFHGVQLRDKEKRTKPYFVTIGVRGKYIYGGYFSTPEAAAAAYDVLAKKYFGEYATLNFPERVVV